MINRPAIIRSVGWLVGRSAGARIRVYMCVVYGTCIHRHVAHVCN